jgi:DNA ligase-1
MAKREFLMLAHKYDPNKHGIAGWFVSEKLDGQRAYWDGGISRGIPKKEVPWANNLKDERLLREPIASGLWSRYGNVIQAPDIWLDQLPPFPLDGELWCGRNRRQRLMSIIKQLVPDDYDWQCVQFRVFDIPSFEKIFEQGHIDNTNFHKRMNSQEIFEFVHAHPVHGFKGTLTIPRQFASIVKILQRELENNNVAYPHEQLQLPFHTTEAEYLLQSMLDSTTNYGGEGLVVRNPSGLWVPERTHDMLKLKKLDDAEAHVAGYVTGRETDKGSKLLGLMGALIVVWEGKRFELSGFTDHERQLSVIQEMERPALDARMWAETNPGEECPPWITSRKFPRGSTVTFRYRGLTRDGIPQEARYYRIP